jgi:predicted CopG family antitoxin
MRTILEMNNIKKTITISEDVYDRLCSLGSKKDTFSTLIDRLIAKASDKVEIDERG